MNDQKGRVSLRSIEKNFGDFRALKDIDLDIEPSEFFALLGPSGSGKSTTLRVIAGLELPDNGTLTVDGQDITYAQPGERNVAMVFQNYALYPHMTIEENIAFPLKMDEVDKAQISDQVQEAARKVKIDHLLHRRPGQLSGGQQQRCALARAIVRQPRLFLLDEPLSNLDAQLRLETRIELRRLHESMDVTTIYVTHDQEEAMTIADRMAIFLDGDIIQVGTPDEVFNHPKTMDVAAFIGSPPMNLLNANIENGGIGIAGVDALLKPPRDFTGTELVVGVRPSHIRLDSDGIPARLLLSENLGESMLLNTELSDGQIVKLRLPEVRRFSPDEMLALRIDADYVHFFDAKSRERILTGDTRKD
ncbi:MAG: ABC transporter ATP-binding protein [Pseudomonadota bacterium]